MTGNIGSGKSTVARLLVGKGAALIDADALAREVASDPEVLAEIAVRLGSDLVKSGTLDRKAAAGRVFDDPQALEALNRIVHPRVRRKRSQRVRLLEAQTPPPPVIVMDIPLLYETGLENDCDAVIVVAAELETRIERLKQARGMTGDEVRARDAAQLPLDEKAARADYVIDNNGDLAALRAQVDRLWPELAAAGKRPPTG